MKQTYNDNIINDYKESLDKFINVLKIIERNLEVSSQIDVDTTTENKIRDAMDFYYRKIKDRGYAKY